MAGRKWIVTGGAGFIGANTTRALAQRGIDAVVLDNLSRPSAALNLEWLGEEVPRSFTFLHADVRDRDAVSQAFREHADAEAVLHLAAQVAVTTSVADPRDDFDTNALGSFNVLEAARLHTPEAAVLYVSTNKVYGDLTSHRIEEAAERYVDADFPDGVSEGHPFDPHSPYGCSKATGDVYALDYARIYGLRTLSLRQSCIYGPRQFGVEDQGWAAWFAIAAFLRRPITIFGSGKQVRDLLHVDDLVELYLQAAERADACAGRAYNIGGGSANTLSLLEALARIEERLGEPLQLSYEDERPADQRVFVCDIARAGEELGWSPKIGVDEGLEALLAWVERHHETASRLLAPA